MNLFTKRRVLHRNLDDMVGRMWAQGVGSKATEVFADGVTVMVDAAAQMSQEMRSQAAWRLRKIADEIQSGEAFEKEQA